MFIIAAIEDKLRILPDQFDCSPHDALIEQIELKYTNKVLLDVGLCVSFYDFLHIGDPYVYPAEGACHQKVRFRMVVFRPFAGEIITGRILSSSREGVIVSLGFFEDILIPHYLLQQPASYDPMKNQWVWNYDADSDAFSMDKGEEVRFKVKTINFTTITNTVKERRTSIVSETRDLKRLTGAPGSSSGSISGMADQSLSEPLTRRRASSSVGINDPKGVPGSSTEKPDPPAMQLIATVQEDGLGLLSWWR